MCRFGAFKENPAFNGTISKREVIMDLAKAIRERRSVRSFTEKVPEEEIALELIDAGRWAPSGLNNQPWKVKIIYDRELIEEIAGMTKYSSTVKGAAFLISVFLDNDLSYHREKDIMAIGAFIQNILLSAYSLGLGSVWLGEILKNSSLIKNILKTDKSLDLMAVIALGYPKGSVQKAKRKTLEEIIMK